MNTSRKAMEWLIDGYLLFTKFKQFNEFCSLSKAAKMSSTYRKWNLSLLRLYSLRLYSLCFDEMK